MKIFLIGDSIMAFNNINRYPQTGWGQALELFLNNDRQNKRYDIYLEDHAINGRSTKSFLAEGRFDIVLDRMSEGDWVICSFGHNDEKIQDPLRYTDANTTYVENLAIYADKVKAKGGNICFATPVTRHLFKDGVLENTHQAYPKAMLDFAKKNGYTCIDLNQLTIDLYNKIGEEASAKFHMIIPANTYKAYPDGKEDHSHLQPLGARVVSELFVRELEKTDCMLKNYFLDLNKEEEIDWAMLKD